MLESPCRHHILDLALKSAFEAKFGSFSASIPLLFKRYKDAWNNINRDNFEAGIMNPFIKTAHYESIHEKCPPWLRRVSAIINPIDKCQIVVGPVQ